MMFRKSITFLVVVWIYFAFTVSWLVEPGFIAKLAADLPVLKTIHEALWPFVHRPYVF